MYINFHNADANIIAHRVFLFCITRRLGKSLSDFLFQTGNVSELKKIVDSKSVSETQFMIIKSSQVNTVAQVVSILRRRGLKSQMAENAISGNALLVYKEPTSGDKDYIRDLDNRVIKTREYFI